MSERWEDPQWTWVTVSGNWVHAVQRGEEELNPSFPLLSTPLLPSWGRDVNSRLTHMPPCLPQHDGLNPWTVSQNKLPFARHLVTATKQEVTNMSSVFLWWLVVSYIILPHLAFYQCLSSSPPTQWHCPGFCHYQFLNPCFIIPVSGSLWWLRPCYLSSSPIWIFWHQCLLN